MESYISESDKNTWACKQHVYNLVIRTLLAGHLVPGVAMEECERMYLF